MIKIFRWHEIRTHNHPFLSPTLVKLKSYLSNSSHPYSCWCFINAKKIFLIIFPCFFLSRLLTEEHIPNKNRSLAGFGAGRMPETLVKKTFSGLWQLCFTQRKPPRNRNPKLFRKMWFRLKQQLMLRFELIFKFTADLILSKRRLYLLIWDPKNTSQGVCPSEIAYLSAKKTTESYKLNLGGLHSTKEAFLLPTQQPCVQLPAPPRFFLLTA